MAIRKNHSWKDPFLKSKAKESSSTACLKCGCVRQYVGGIVTYFIDDTVYDRKAPSCDERLMEATGYDSLEEILLMQG